MFKFLENAHNLEIANKWKMLENLLNLENTRKSEKYWEMLENPFSGYETIENLECATHWKMLRVYGTINSHCMEAHSPSVWPIGTL